MNKDTHGEAFRFETAVRSAATVSLAMAETQKWDAARAIRFFEETAISLAGIMALVESPAVVEAAPSPNTRAKAAKTAAPGAKAPRAKEPAAVVDPKRPRAPRVGGKLVPAVPVSESLAYDYIVCLEDGWRGLMLNRHLTDIGMTKADYLERWNLPEDYAMTAPAYALRKQAEAKRNGLGTKANKAGATMVQYQESILHAQAA